MGYIGAIKYQVQRAESMRVAKVEQPDKLRCPCCGKWRPVTDTNLLRAEADCLAAEAADTRRPPGWSVEAARAGRLQWACRHCIKAGRALAGYPAVQTWCDYDPYFAFVDAELRCEDCGKSFVFAAAEQRFWYETLKFWVQSRPKQCIPCRRTRRARNRATREEQVRRHQERHTESGRVSSSGDS